MNPQMRLMFMLGVMTATGSILFAAEEPTARAPANPTAEKADAPPAPTSAEPSPSPAAPPGSENKAAEPVAPEDQDPAPPPKGAASGERTNSPQRFTPSEQVRADFDVSFPIDI